jgi:nucleotide-binding universal stress UspA family protein
MYKTIVVHVDGSTHEGGRLHAAAQLANGFEAHLVGSAVTGMSWAGYALLGAPVYPALIDESFRALRATAGTRLRAFEDCARAEGVSSFESRLAEEDAGFALLLQARFADLIVLGQDAGAVQAPPGNGHGLCEQVILDGGRPVLVVPDAWKGQLLTGTAVVGWDGSMPAVRAITGALPLLRRAQSVKLVLVNPAQQHRLGDVEPGADMALYLARHGVTVEVVVEHAADGAGEALLARADADGVNLLVAGAFGHSRYREWVLGGVTRDLLQRARVPVLFAH